MKYRNIGNSGLKVSEISLGVMNFNGGKLTEIGSVDQSLADRLVSISINHGINLFDTADVYSKGVSETMLGKALGNKRKEALLATKVRYRMSDDPGDTGLSRAHILKSCEASLRRLGTDYIDLYQIHSYDPNTPLEETLEALDSLVRAGKVRFIGCSNLAAWQLMKAKHLSAILQLNSFISAQMYYSIGVRDIEHEIVPLCLDQHIGILCWSPLSGGFFTGKYQREHLTPKNSRRSHREASSLKYWFLDEEKGFSILAALEPMSQNRQVSVAQLALSWLLYKPAVTSLVIGARNEKQLLENIAAADLSVSREEMNELDKVSEPYIPYPMSHQLLGE